MDAYGALPGMIMRVRPDEIIPIRPASLINGRSFCVRKNAPLKWFMVDTVSKRHGWNKHEDGDAWEHDRFTSGTGKIVALRKETGRRGLNLPPSTRRFWR